MPARGKFPPLDEYRRKRRFPETPEPEGAVPASNESLRFVVQKHAASRLHYDFRLQLDGVLKSWAVPKGPSMNPKDKRLAMMVEDHPLEYETFEGVIPKGSYGGGTVMVWDAGPYRAASAEDEASQSQELARGLRKGHLAFVLDGEKLRGAFDLVRVHGREENAWLLIKKADDFASTTKVILLDRSVRTGRDMEEIAHEAPAHGDVWLSARKVEVDLSGAPEADMPERLSPMLATPRSAPFSRENWVFEIKWDGYRALARIDGASVDLYSRNLQSYHDRFPSIANALSRIGRCMLLDGEIVALNEDGKPNFGLLQGQPSESSLVYYVFDILFLDGHDLTRLPLLRRKDILSKILPSLPQVRVSDFVANEGKRFFALAAAQGLEGVIGKDAASRYIAGKRSASWIKVKAQKRTEAVIGGFTELRAEGPGVGALLLGQEKDDALVYIGHTGTGFDQRTREQLERTLSALEIDSSPFTPKPRPNGKVHWVRPEVRCTVEFTAWTDAGHLRHPVFLELQSADDDHDASLKVTAETTDGEATRPVPAAGDAGQYPTATTSTHPPRRKFPGIKSKDKSVSVDGQRVKLTNLDKIYWPDDGYTKGDLIEYYRAVATHILPHVRDRPESMRRYPNGIRGDSFFQKDTEGKTPSWIQQVPIASDTHDEITYLLCQNQAALLYMANLGCIDLNPWFSRVESLDRPDFAVIDLDPLDVDFETLRAVALTVREVLDRMKCPCFCKTSGAKGIHICVPLGARYDYDLARQFSEIVARLVNSMLPDITSVERSPQKRQKRVYVDFLQNRRSQTLASVYSVRPYPGATVSTPVTWDELSDGVTPDEFTIDTVPARIAKLGDLWEPVIGPGVDLMQVLSNAGGSNG